MVRVEWIDSGMSRSNGWEEALAYVNASHKEDVLKVISVGWLLHADEEHVILAQSWDKENDTYLNGQIIWRKAMTKFDDLASSTPAFTKGSPDD
jgi:hypothetical protein